MSMQQHFLSAWDIAGLFQGSSEFTGLQRETSFQGAYSPAGLKIFVIYTNL